MSKNELSRTEKQILAEIERREAANSALKKILQTLEEEAREKKAPREIRKSESK